jgi:hypothetical protein
MTFGKKIFRVLLEIVRDSVIYYDIMDLKASWKIHIPEKCSYEDYKYSIIFQVSQNA